ncbi:hypothetical protein M405DRAFT_912445, partial [Rhizopogon salebrosus TDB-379]
VFPPVASQSGSGTSVVQDMKSLGEYVQKATGSLPKLVLQFGDVHVGVPTQCIRENKIERVNEQYCANLSMKQAGLETELSIEKLTMDINKGKKHQTDVEKCVPEKVALTATHSDDDEDEEEGVPPGSRQHADELHQENVIYYGTLQTTTEHYVVLCSKIQPTDVAHFKKREFAADSEYLEERLQNTDPNLHVLK